MMDEQRKADYESKSLELRAELKLFEGEWAQKHDGKKPSREAIKQNPDIGNAIQTALLHLLRLS